MSGLPGWRMRHPVQRSMLRWSAAHGSGGSAPRRRSLLRSQARCALTPAATPWVRAEPPSQVVRDSIVAEFTTSTAAE